MRALLDVNVLLALVDRDHLDHQRARAWLEAEIADGWASCPITENGFVHIISQPCYPNPITPAEAASLLEGATHQPHHQSGPATSACSTLRRGPVSPLHGPRQVTDAYLLALATAHQGRFVTFDLSISLAVVKGATADNLIVV